MKKIKIYIDTSVFGGCFDEEFSEYSNKIIFDIQHGLYQGVISEISINEIEKAPDRIKDLVYNLPSDNINILQNTDEVTTLAQRYIDEQVVSNNYIEDALHIAFATVYNIDLLISWNFRHIVNYSRINQFNAVNLKQGYKPLEIRSPRELYYYENKNL